jgi:signal transduction histidine kinase
MIDLYEPSMTEKGLTIENKSNTPVRIDADAALIHRMVANLFDNEIKHLPTGSSITVQLGIDFPAALLTIEDDGPGFAPDVLPHLFERRVKGKESKGHGLGLAFVDAVTRAHWGTVEAWNRKEGGASITVTLPLAAPQKRA